jgi:hypothetical protein
MNRGRWLGLGVAAIASILQVSAAAAANKCVDSKGRVTYQDTACEKPRAVQSPVDTSEAFSTKPSTAAPTGRTSARPGSTDSAYANAHGQWRGPVQFQLTLGGVRDSPAQAVTPMVIERTRPPGDAQQTDGLGHIAVVQVPETFRHQRLVHAAVTTKQDQRPRWPFLPASIFVKGSASGNMVDEMLSAARRSDGRNRIVDFRDTRDDGACNATAA